MNPNLYPMLHCYNVGNFIPKKSRPFYGKDFRRKERGNYRIRR